MTPRQLLVCCDGTSNNVTGRQRDTNVIKMLDLLSGVPGQVVYYDPGVGNGGVLPGVTYKDKVKMMWDRLSGLAFGGGIYENVAQGYRFVMREYRGPEDELYFFGFSRGAFTARCIAGMVRKFGVLPPHMTAMVPTLVHIYFSKRNTPQAKKDNEAVTDQVRATFSIPDSLRMKVHFVGTWDTVESVGAPLFKKVIASDPTIAGKALRHVRQALALDEHRGPFSPRLYSDPNGPVGDDQTVKQAWFPGAHCDVGGGYEDSCCTISNEALAWLLEEARDKGLRMYVRGELVPDLAAIEKAVGARCQVKPRAPKVHSAIYDMCLWAIAGLKVRETPQGIEHPTVNNPAPSFPADTVWSKPRTKTWVTISGLATIAASLNVGRVLMGRGPAGWTDLAGLWSLLPDYLAANGKVALLQLAWWMHGGDGYSALQEMATLRPALLADILLIAMYGCFLSWFVVRGFASVAGLNRVQAARSRVLNLLGYALPTAMAADVAENVLTCAVLAVTNVNPAACILAVFMSLAAALKWLSLAAVVCLIAWGWKK